VADADQQQAIRFGVSERTVNYLRMHSLIEGEHWIHVTGGSVTYTSAGLSRLAELLDCKKKEGGGGGDFESETPPSIELALPIVRLMPNPTGVIVRLPDGNSATVRIRASKAARVGARIRCLRAANGALTCIHPGLAPPNR